MARSVAACLAVLLALFEVGSCVKCYQCNSQSNKSCGDPFTETALVDCKDQSTVQYNQQYLYDVLPAEAFAGIPGAPRYCHTIVTESKTVIRTCLDGSPDDMNHLCKDLVKNTESALPGKKIKSCKACNTDKCNGAGSITYSLPLALISLVASYLLYKQ